MNQKQRPRRRSTGDQKLINQLQSIGQPQPVRKSQRTKPLQQTPPAAPQLPPAKLTYHCTAQTAREIHEGLQTTFGVLCKSQRGDLPYLRCGTGSVGFEQQTGGHYTLKVYGSDADADSTHRKLMAMPASKWLYHPDVFAQRLAKSIQIEHSEMPAPQLPPCPAIHTWVMGGPWWIDRDLPIEEFVSTLKRRSCREIQPPIGADMALQFGNVVIALVRHGDRWQVAISADGDYMSVTEMMFRSQEIDGRPGTVIWGYLKSAAPAPGRDR